MENSVLGQKFGFWSKIRFFWSKIGFWSKNRFFVQKFGFWSKIRFFSPHSRKSIQNRPALFTFIKLFEITIPLFNQAISNGVHTCSEIYYIKFKNEKITVLKDVLDKLLREWAHKFFSLQSFGLDFGLQLSDSEAHCILKIKTRSCRPA